MKPYGLLGNTRLSVAAAICSFAVITALAEDQVARQSIFADEPAAHARFDAMIKAMRDAESLAYECHHTWSVDAKSVGDFNYRVKLKKPNHFRIEVHSRDDTIASGILIGDGEHAWLHWPQGRPHWELVPEDPETYQRTRLTSYMKHSVPRGRYSIGHALPYTTTVGMMPIINPSTFYGYNDTLSPYIDGVRDLGNEQVGTEDCHKVEVSIMDGQRSWYLWLSQRDHLPRKQKQIVRVSSVHEMEEEWSDVVINADLPDELFQWSPPQGWTEWVRAEPDDLLLGRGTKAPEFDLASASGERIKLADFRGQVVWLYIWRAGCPPCREGLRDVQDFYAKYRDQGLVVLGLNDSDEKSIALEFLQEKGATFPNILDSSEAAQTLTTKDYRTTGVPVNYVIDAQGNVVDAWYGHTDGHARENAALQQAGLDVGESVP